MKTSSRISRVALFSLLLQLCIGASAGTVPPPGRQPVNTLHGKISPDMRERLLQGASGVTTVGVILQLNGSRPSGRLNALLNRNGVHVRAEFRHFNSLALELPAEAVEELASIDEVSYVSPDRDIRPHGHISTTGLDAARAQAGAGGGPNRVDGSGVGVAVLDSGIYNGHVMFEGAGGSKRVVKNVDFVCPKCRTPDFKDMYGHGTHVAGLLAGNSQILSGAYSDGRKVYGMIHSPGHEPSAITVGASNTFGTDERTDDAVSTYSSRGPTRGSWTDESGQRRYDHLIKPELVAPGNKLVSSGRTSYMPFQTNVTRPEGTVDDSRKMLYLSGTSMATPLVSGAAALLLQANPRLTPNMVKMILMYTAQPLAGFNQLEQGAGQLNVEGAPLLTGDDPPSAQTTVAGLAFPWAQGILLRHGYATGDELITKYQRAYGAGTLFSDGKNIQATSVLVHGDNTACMR